jgi:hypothetical protein
MNNIPQNSDVKIFHKTGAVYVRCHFVSIGLDKYSKDHIETKAKEANATHTSVINNVFNAMFGYEVDAEKFGNSL